MLALIGSNGFVGRNLNLQMRFDVGVSSKGVALLEGQALELLVCAGTSAEKWRANADPAADWRAIKRLMVSLSRIQTQRMVLISTIDVYPQTLKSDERLADYDAQQQHAYGRHRRALEEFVIAQFPAALIVRLPALYGLGLKKNALFDLIHRHNLGALNAAASFQWYGLQRLGADLERALAAGLQVVNLFPEPLELGELAARFFADVTLSYDAHSAARYALTTIHAELFGGSNGWIENRAQVLSSLAHFLR